MNESITHGSSPRRIRLTNAIGAMQNLYRQRWMSRAELARGLGLNRSSSGQVVAELTKAGLVREVEQKAPSRGDRPRSGRPGVMLELVSDAAYFVGIEIGVEHISVVTIDLLAKVRFHQKQPFDATSETIEVAVSRAVDASFGAMEPAVAGRCRGVGISAPMHISPEGLVRIAPLIGWRDVALVEIAAAALPAGMPIMIENDANAFAIGESYRNHSSGVTLFLVMETGIGGGILIDGKLFRGGHGLAGEIGHTLVQGSGRRTLEQMIGREALVMQYRSAIDNKEVDLPELLAGVRDREPMAVSIAEEWSRHLGFALIQACRLIDPQRIVLGGSVASLYPMVSARVAAHMKVERELPFPSPEIVVEEEAEFGSAFGAACLLHQRFLSLENEVLDREGSPSPRSPSPPTGPAARNEDTA